MSLQKQNTAKISIFILGGVLSFDITSSNDKNAMYENQ